MQVDYKTIGTLRCDRVEEIHTIGKSLHLKARSDQHPAQRFAYLFVVVD